MNCKQAEELLPLYAGRDLDEKRTRLVTEHLQSCDACARIADEYREAFHLTQQFATPVFAEGLYAGIRQRVLREIETESKASSLPQFVASWFTPRLAWTVAAALLIAVAASATYFVVNRSNGKESAGGQVVRTPEILSPVDPVTPPDKPSGISSPTNTGAEKQRLGGVRQPAQKRSPDVVANRANDTVVVSSNAVSADASSSTDSLPAPTLFPPPDTATSEKSLRMEIQTRDPNIRIIWFAQQETKPAVPALKGT